MFRDIETIATGVDFVKTVEAAVDASDVMLVVIGPDWLTITDDEGNRRLEDPEDYVRLEVEKGLARGGLHVIPVLVSGAGPPPRTDLPGPVKELASRNALEVRETRFDDDVDHLIAEIGGRARVLSWVKRHRARTAAIGGAVIAGGVLAVGLFGRDEPPLTGDLTVAVADFTATGDAEQADASDLATAAFTEVSSVLIESGEVTDEGLAGPDRVSPLSGSDVPADAQAIAGEIGADVLIYGELDVSGGQSRFNSGFFLSDEKLEDAEELAGVYQLGEVRVASDVAATVKPMVTDLISTQAAALSELIIGLRHYAANDFETAESHLLSAEQQWQAVDGGASATSGKEVVLHMLGNVSGASGDLGAARSYYEAALEIDPTYSRALFGLAEVSFAESTGSDSCRPAGSPRIGDLEAAGAQFERVRSMAAPPLSFLAERAGLEIGRIELCLSVAGQDRLDEARASLTAVVDANDGSDPRLDDLAAEAHQSLAVVDILDGDFQNALDHYDAAIAFTFDDTRRATFYEARGDVYLCYLDDPDAAQIEYRAAADIRDRVPVDAVAQVRCA